MTTIFGVCGKVNYTNLSRYSDVSERTYRLHFQRGLGFERLNQGLVESLREGECAQIAGVDCTFVETSGRHTYGLDWFYNGKPQRPERGVERSVVGIVDLEQNTAYTLSAQQTEEGLSAQPEAPVDGTPSKGNRIEFYLGHVADCMTFFPVWIRYVVADGFYSKYKWVTGVVNWACMRLANCAVTPIASSSMTVPTLGGERDGAMMARSISETTDAFRLSSGWMRGAASIPLWCGP